MAPCPLLPAVQEVIVPPAVVPPAHDDDEHFLDPDDGLPEPQPRIGQRLTERQAHVPGGSGVGEAMSGSTFRTVSVRRKQVISLAVEPAPGGRTAGVGSPMTDGMWPPIRHCGREVVSGRHFLCLWRPTCCTALDHCGLLSPDSCSRY